jgi:hypothetical protein
MKTAPTQLSAECPQCRQETGQVRAAATVAGKPAIIRLTIRCVTCAHHWHVDREADRPFLIPGLAFLRTEDLV